MNTKFGGNEYMANIFIPWKYLDGEEKSLEKVLGIMGKSKISELFSDADTIKPGTWSKDYYEVTTNNPKRCEDDPEKEIITLQLYREVIDGDVYSGRLTLEWFWGGAFDNGDFGGHIDAGISEEVCLAKEDDE